MLRAVVSALVALAAWVMPTASAAFALGPALSVLEFTPSSLRLFPDFSPTVYVYSVSSNRVLSRVSIRAECNGTADAFVQLRLNDGPFIHGAGGDSGDQSSSLSLSLLEGINHLLVQSGDEESRTTTTYLLTLCNGNGNKCQAETQAMNVDAHLSSLALQQLALTPAFSPLTFLYTVRSTRHIHAAVIEATLALSHHETLIASSMNGEVLTGLTEKHSSDAMPMKIGRNFLFIQVRSPRDTLATYTVIIDRGAESHRDRAKTWEEKEEEIDYIGGVASIAVQSASTSLASLISTAGLLSPRFHPAVTAYSQVVDFHTSSIRLTAVSKDIHARMHLTFAPQGKVVPRVLMLESKMASEPIKLEVGGNIVTLWVATNDVESSYYSINVTRLNEDNEGAITTAGNRHSHHRTRASSYQSQHSDPALIGIRGQRYTVHVEEGEVYNLLSDPHLLVNARWNKFPNYNNELGITEIGIVTRSGHTLHIQSGADVDGSNDAFTGFSRVALNEAVMAPEDQAIIDNSEEEFHEEQGNIQLQHEQNAAAAESDTDGIVINELTHRQVHSHQELLAFNTSTVFSVITSTWHLTLIDTPRGIDSRMTLIGELTVGAHGLQGQTYRAKRAGRIHQHDNSESAGSHNASVGDGTEGQMPLIEGDMLDFRINDGNLFSANFEFNLFDSEAE